MFKIEKLTLKHINIEYFKLLSQLTVVNLDYLDQDKIKNFLLSLNEKHQVFVLIDDELNKVIGTITILIEHKLIRNFGIVGHIEDVVIDSNYRGKNLGKKIIDFAINYCNNKGCYKVILDCDEKNIGFYKKCGFKLKGFEMSLYFFTK
ncbi:histone acetyltransferase [bacterium]|nr:histone acetyltransferase [bacterium]|tara:strand:- start:549 stop:992 length:444 start_codon:yes stop_codon:yes gene_type:complete